MNDEHQPDPFLQNSDRSSLSPPPPITLRLGMKQAIVEKAAYSSSSSGEDGPGPSKHPRPSPVKKVHPPPLEGASSLPAQHRKSYDWLQPSSAAASHHGPPERVLPKIMGWTPSEEGSEGKEGKKKSHKRRPEGAPLGPGKAWRKGLKKYVLLVPRERDGLTGVGAWLSLGEREGLFSMTCLLRQRCRLTPEELL